MDRKRDQRQLTNHLAVLPCRYEEQIFCRGRQTFLASDQHEQEAIQRLWEQTRPDSQVEVAVGSA